MGDTGSAAHGLHGLQEGGPGRPALAGGGGAGHEVPPGQRAAAHRRGLGGGWHCGEPHAGAEEERPELYAKWSKADLLTFWFPPFGPFFSKGPKR